MTGFDDTDWTLVDFGEPKKAASTPVPKGTCPKCGKHIGKGLHFHEKSCDPSRASRTGEPATR